MDALNRSAPAWACEINPSGLVLWRCHTHGSPALRQGPCLATSSDRRLAHLAALVGLGAAARRAIESERHVRAARGGGEALVWASQATAGRLMRGNP